MFTKKEWNRIHGEIEEGHRLADLDFELQLLEEIWKLWNENDELRSRLRTAENEIRTFAVTPPEA